MAFEVSVETLRTAAQDTILAGGFLMALAYGIRRIYRMARNIETLVQSAHVDAAERKRITDTLTDHINTEEARDARMDEIIQSLTVGQNEILREMRPNGGSSMKDIINQVQRDVAVLSQWKEDVQGHGVRKLHNR